MMNAMNAAMGGGGLAGQAPAATPSPDLQRVRFASQLAQLSAMGFNNEAACLRALAQHEGRDINPEHLTPETRDVQIGVIMGELLHLRSKPSRSRRRREDSRDTVPHGLRGGRSGASSASGRSGKSYATGKATDGRVVPEIIGVSEGVLPATGRWEFEAGSGFKPFDEDCQAEVEQLYQQFKNGGHHRAEVQTKGKRISLDFKLMTSMVVGSRTVRQIRRQ
eukprot:g3371.t1